MDPIAGAAINSATQMSQSSGVGNANNIGKTSELGSMPQEGQPSQENVNAFQEAMNTPKSEQVNNTSNTQNLENNQPLDAKFETKNASAVENMPPASVQKTPGENILDNFSSSFRSTQNGATEMANNMGGEMGDLLRLQMEVARTTFNQTMVGQVGSKAGQGAQQLLKGQ